MQQLVTTAPQSHGRNFADLLAGLTLPAKKPPQRDLDGLEDDVATLSYEQALSSRSGPPLSPAEVPALQPVACNRMSESPVAAPRQLARRSSSVTVRFSPSEAEQLRVRAAEAGLTVSAYLRSCAFEVESLRAEVKSTLGQFRSAALAPEVKRDRPHHRWFGPWRRLFRKES